MHFSISLREQALSGGVDPSAAREREREVSFRFGISTCVRQWNGHGKWKKTKRKRIGRKCTGWYFTTMTTLYISR
ncbi:hypothetical protein QQG55_47360 [Brugia pahangi]